MHNCFHGNTSLCRGDKMTAFEFGLGRLSRPYLKTLRLRVFGDQWLAMNSELLELLYVQLVRFDKETLPISNVHTIILVKPLDININQ